MVSCSSVLGDGLMTISPLARRNPMTLTPMRLRASISSNVKLRQAFRKLLYFDLFEVDFITTLNANVV